MLLPLFAALLLSACGGGAPEVPFTRAKRETLVSNLVTNGRTEAWEWRAVHSEVGGEVERLLVEQGANVAAGAPIATVDATRARADLAAAEARIAAAEAELSRLERGGPADALAAIEASAGHTRLELEVARRESASLERLERKGAATRAERDAALDRVRMAEAELRSLDEKRKAVVDASDKQAAAARLREAKAAAGHAMRAIEMATLRAPIAGSVYRLDIRRGSFLQPGAKVAEIGRLDRLRAVLYVDEPELGRVALRLPVKLTWDARPGREWTGEVEKLPTQVVALGTRQVGEVLCGIGNPGLLLPPGANVNAEIRAQVVENALTIPKECLRREGAASGVYVLDGDKVSWRVVEPGASSITRAEIRQGLKEGEAVALPSDAALSTGKAVRAIFP